VNGANDRAAPIDVGDSQFARFVAQFPCLAFLKDHQGVYRFVTPSFERHFGMTRDWILGRTDQELWPREIAQKQIAHDQRIREQGVEEQLEEALPVEGIARMHEVSKFPVPMEDGTVWVGGIALESSRAAQRDEMLEAERSFTSAILDVQRALVVALDTEGRIRRFNVACEKLTGWRSEEVLGHHFGDLFLPEDCRREVLAVFDSLVAGETPLEFENEWMTKTGERRLIEWHNSVLRDSAGDVSLVIGTGIDITEERERAVILREQDARMRAMSDASPLGMFMTDPDGQCVYVNERYATLSGLAESDCLGRGWIKALHPDDRENVVQLWNDYAHSSMSHLALVTRYGTSDDDFRWVQVKAAAVEEAGRLLGYVGTVEDITLMRHREDLIREQADLLDHANDAILVRDMEDRLIYWNASAERIFGWSAGEALGRRAIDLIYGGKIEKTLDAARKEVIEKGRWKGDLFPQDRQGNPIVVQASWTLIRDDAGRPKSILSISSDVTKNRELEQQFFRAQRLESLGVLAGGIAHDLNNVFAPIVMAVDTLREELEGTESDETLEMLAESASRGADLVRQVLLFARGSEGPRGAIDLMPLISEIRRIVVETFPKSISLQEELDTGLWQVNADPTQLQQVILNLCVNARDAMPSGGTLTLRVQKTELGRSQSHAAQHQRSGPAIAIEVEDEGEGMPPEVVNRIFEPFFTTKAAGQGTGLGLSTALSIVRSHGGDLTVDSRPGAGSTFRIVLPAILKNTLRTVREPAIVHDSEGRRILVVDDEAAIRNVSARLLSSRGYEVMTAENGQEAIERFREQHGAIPVVLLDMAMPVMDGTAAIPILREIDPEVKIIAASGLSVNHNAQDTGFSGVDYFLQKPFASRDLFKALESVLPRK